MPAKSRPRYRYRYIDLDNVHIDSDLFRSIPVDLMFRYNFVPMTERNGSLEIAIADPRQLPNWTKSPAAGQEAAHQRLASVADQRSAEENRAVATRSRRSHRGLRSRRRSRRRRRRDPFHRQADRRFRHLADHPSVDTTIFNALERRASDIHIETRNAEVAIKYRIDGVLHYAMPPISKDWHETIVSRIKVMSELDIAERRVPQDGRFRVRYKWPPDRLPRLDHAHGAWRGLRPARPRQRVDEREILLAFP